MSTCNLLAVVDAAAVELASAGDVDGGEVEGSAAGSAMSVQVDALVRQVRSVSVRGVFKSFESVVDGGENRLKGPSVL